MAIPRTAIAMRERMPIAIRAVSNKATLREAAYRAKLSSLPGPSRDAVEKPALTPALRSVMRAHLQNRFVIESPFVAPAQKAAQGGGTRLSQKAREGARSKCFAQQGPTRQTILGGSAHLRQTLLS